MYVPRAGDETENPVTVERLAVRPGAKLDGGRKAIEARDLTFSYDGSDGPAVRGMSFSVGRGEVFGFLGPSGAGKSTTQKVVIGLLKG